MPAKNGILPRVGLRGEHRDRARLSDRLDRQHAGHDRPPGKVAGEPPVVRADLAPPDDALARLELEDLVDEQERRPMRNERLDHVAAERGVGTLMLRCRRGARAAARVRGARGTSRCRRACRRPRRSPRTNSRARPSAERPAPAPAKQPRAQSHSSRRSSDVARIARRIVARLKLVAERLVHAPLAALDCVAARVDDEAVQPGRELRVAAELPQADARPWRAPPAPRRSRLPDRAGTATRAARPSGRGGRAARRAHARSPSFARCTRIGSLSFS